MWTIKENVCWGLIRQCYVYFKSFYQIISEKSIFFFKIYINMFVFMHGYHYMDWHFGKLHKIILQQYSNNSTVIPVACAL